jgi:hypothetical protein
MISLVEHEWGTGSCPRARFYAARKALFWAFDNTQMEKQDANAVLDNTILVGMLAASAPNSRKFVEAFNAVVLKGW